MRIRRFGDDRLSIVANDAVGADLRRFDPGVNALLCRAPTSCFSQAAS
jgi:hypothetical protein